ncbi:hypothetical protein [Nonomuraea angiospora]|uniref:hypothetical protein n=1 Tax=Nonomuraea angiospora TaxID=46172 RepID=UPI0029BC216F|nr:hypothetical protein [Nonomuraea angiospora]MDX3108946.1 hypothetical protein [Nonomuraea angiospora]
MAEAADRRRFPDEIAWLFDALGLGFGVAADNVRGAGVDVGGEVATTERPSTLWRGAGIEATCD